MKNIDDVVKNIKTGAVSAASILTKKASDVYDISKSKLAAESIKREIVKKFTKLGKLSYKNATEGTDKSEEIDILIAEISDLKGALSEIEGTIASLKNQKICPNCNSVVSKNSIFCNICGTKFEEEVEEEAECVLDDDDDVITEVEVDIEIESADDETEAEESACDGTNDETTNAQEDVKPEEDL